MKTRHIATLGQLPNNSTQLGQTLTFRDRKKIVGEKHDIQHGHSHLGGKKNLEKPQKKTENPAQRVK
jgi:hypothetical protein